MTAIAALREVTVTVGRGRRVLDGLTLDIGPGERHIVHGSSGTGKSTMLNLLAGYLEPDSGTVRRCPRTSYLLQGDWLFSALTSVQNLQVRPSLGFGPSALQECTDLLERVGLGHVAHEPVSSLSGGERQRLQLAGLLADRADLVLMDEPTSSLDRRTRDEICRVIDAVFTDTALVIVSHDPDLPSLISASTVVCLEDGALTHG